MILVPCLTGCSGIEEKTEPPVIDKTHSDIKIYLEGSLVKETVMQGPLRIENDAYAITEAETGKTFYFGPASSIKWTYTIKEK